MSIPFTMFDSSQGDRLLPFITGEGAPVNGVTGAGVMKKGWLYIDETNGEIYKNTGTLTSPTWTEIAALTGDALSAETLAITATTEATSATAAPLKSAGGLGIAKKAFIGGSVSMLDRATALTAAGTSRTDALALTKQFNDVTTVGAATAGVTLPSAAGGFPVFVWNNGANAMHVYALGSETIDGVAGATGVVLTNDKSAVYYPISATAYVSMMGVKSA